MNRIQQIGLWAGVVVLLAGGLALWARWGLPVALNDGLVWLCSPFV